MQTVPSVSTAIPPGLDPLALAGALCARLCHDLAGSLGALTGTLEVAAEEGDREALELAITLSREVSSRLRLLRAAWGAGSDVPAPETMLAGLPGADRLTLDCSGLQTTGPESLRLCLSLLLVAASGLPRGGAICLAGNESGLTLSIEGKRAGFPEALAECLGSDQALLAACETPRSLAVALACLQARASGRAIALESPTQLIAQADR